MRILIFSWRGPGHPNAGGAELVTHEYAKAWVAAGHSVTLFTSIFPGADIKESMDGVEIIRQGSQHLTVQFYAWRWFVKNKKMFDIVFDHFHGIPFYTPLYVRTKKVAFIHEVAREVWKLNALPAYIQWLPSLVGPFVEKFTFKLYRNIPFLTVSQSTKNDLVEYGILKENITVIANGVTIPKEMKRFNKEEVNTVLYLGPLAKDKGIDDALNVFSLLHRSDEKWNFWIVGKGGAMEVEWLKRQMSTLNIEKQTIYWGFVTEKKKFELLQRAHILINPSVHEGWGLVNIEANACGTPVVAYDVHGCRDSIKDGETGILVAKGDIRGMAEKIIELIENKIKSETMQKNAIMWSEEFTWAKSTKESIAYLEELHNNRK